MQLYGANKTSGTGLVIYSSTDGATWTEVSSALSAVSIQGRVWLANGVYFVFRSGSPTTFFTSTDLVNWTERTAGAHNQFAGAVFCNGEYIIARSSSNQIAFSTDLVTWTTRSTTGVPGNITHLASNGTRLVAATTTTPFMAYSDDNTSFTSITGTLTGRNSSTPTFFYFKNGRFVAGVASNIWYSDNGALWSTAGDNQSISYTDLEYGENGIWVACSASGLATWGVYVTPSEFTYTWFVMTNGNVAITGPGGRGGDGAQPGGGGGAGGSGSTGGRGGDGGAGRVRVFTW